MLKVSTKIPLHLSNFKPRPSRHFVQAFRSYILVGRSLLTDEELAGVLSVGMISSVGKLSRAMIKLGSEAEEVSSIVKTSEKVLETLGEMGARTPENVEALQRATRRNFIKDPIATLKDINEGISYRPGTRFAEGTLNEPTQNLVRVFNASGGNMVGQWVVDERMITNGGKLMGGLEIKNLLNLPDIPTNFVKLAVPAGTPVRISQIARNAYGTYEGMIQIQILSERSIIEKMLNLSTVGVLSK